MQIADTSVFENIKEKITNPIIFTYFWVFCTWNHREILILFFEPKLFSNKMVFLSEWCTFLCPLVVAALALLCLPWLNNYVEMWKQRAHQYMQVKLDEWGWIPMVEDKVYQSALQQINLLKSELNTFRKNEDVLNSKIKELTKTITGFKVPTESHSPPINTNEIHYNPTSTFNEFTAAAQKLSQESLYILKESNLNPSQPIIAIDTKSGFHIKVNSSVINNKEEDEFSWRNAIIQLVKSSFITKTTEDSYLLTEVGSSIAKRIEYLE